MAEPADTQHTSGKNIATEEQPSNAGTKPIPGVDPRATDHPTGTAQAAENAENEPAG
ncbi:MAG: hypothetical protein M3446_05405 [Actinomycetota bacterium]|jgi:hypothetical protein|nr:hypothetical protein [Actinomycetota bacterium]